MARKVNLSLAEAVKFYDLLSECRDDTYRMVKGMTEYSAVTMARTIIMNQIDSALREEVES